jgi:hypothetical protein
MEPPEYERLGIHPHTHHGNEWDNFQMGECVGSQLLVSGSQILFVWVWKQLDHCFSPFCCWTTGWIFYPNYPTGTVGSVSHPKMVHSYHNFIQSVPHECTNCTYTVMTLIMVVSMMLIGAYSVTSFGWLMGGNPLLL